MAVLEHKKEKEEDDSNSNSNDDGDIDDDTTTGSDQDGTISSESSYDRTYPQLSSESEFNLAIYQDQNNAIGRLILRPS